MPTEGGFLGLNAAFQTSATQGSRDRNLMKGRVEVS
jgi:hypothetical protein